MTFRLFLSATLFVPGCLFAQDKTDLPVIRRPSIGLRLEYISTRPFETRSASASTTKPIADYTYSASAGKGQLRLSPNIEFRLTKRMSLGAEFLFHQVKYQQVTEIRSGNKDPNSATDGRPVTRITETTRASYWELPVLARYYGLGRTGLLSRTYVAGGVAFRHVANIRTGNEYANADSTTDYNEIRAQAKSTNQAAVIAAAGLRLVDDYRVKITPEVRVTHWSGTTFEGPAFRSTSNTVSAGLGISF